MKTTFYIDLSLKTPGGPEPYGRFFIGNNREKAYELFTKLICNKDVNESDMLFLDLMEMQGSLPLNLKMISCTLEQLCQNCKTITRELFQMTNLKT
jgi:hypothetical protein